MARVTTRRLALAIVIGSSLCSGAADERQKGRAPGEPAKPEAPGTKPAAGKR